MGQFLSVLGRVKDIFTRPADRVTSARQAREAEECTAQELAAERAAAERERSDALARLSRLRAESRLHWRRR